jgi:hypothetical protein
MESDMKNSMGDGRAISTVTEPKPAVGLPAIMDPETAVREAVTQILACLGEDRGAMACAIRCADGEDTASCSELLRTRRS